MWSIEVVLSRILGRVDKTTSECGKRWLRSKGRVARRRVLRVGGGRDGMCGVMCGVCDLI